MLLLVHFNGIVPYHAGCWKTVDPDQFASLADLDLHCFQISLAY